MSASFEAGQRLWLKDGQIVEFVGPAGESRCIVARVVEFIDDDEDDETYVELGDQIVVQADDLHTSVPRAKIDAEITEAQQRLADLQRQIQQQNQALRLSPDKQEALKGIQTLEILHAWVTGQPLWFVTVEYDTNIRVHQRQPGEKRYELRQSYAKRAYDLRGGECFWDVGISDEKYSSIHSRHVFLCEAEAIDRARAIASEYATRAKDRLKYEPESCHNIAASMRLLGMEVPAWIDEIIVAAKRKKLAKAITEAESQLRTARDAEAQYVAGLPAKAQS